jgi:hypothetical protein
MISNCTTCPGFSFCENPAKLGGLPSMPSMIIKYDSDNPSSSRSIQVEIHPQKRSETRVVAVSPPRSIEERSLDSWLDINPQRLARYGSKSNNIFLQLQDQSIPGSIPGDDYDDEKFQQNPTLFLSLPPPDDLPIDDNMGYFLSSRMDAFLGFRDCFSSAYKSLYLLSANHRVLRHVLFAFVNYLNDQDRITQSAACGMHLRKVILPLQNSLTFLNFDEGHILAIPLLAYLAFWSRNFDVAKSHLTGFYKMLLHAQFLEQDKTGKISVSTRMSSLMLLMWRVAVRLDHYFGFMKPEEQILAPIQRVPGSNQRYIAEFIDPSSTEWIECLVISDDLEDVRNLVVHYNRRATVVRGFPGYTPDDAQRYIVKAGRKVIRQLEQLNTDILSAAEDYNIIHQPVFEPAFYATMEPFPSNQLSHYSSIFRSLHERFIEAILINRAMIIHTTITSHPKAGADPPERLGAAIEICCAFSILKERMPFAFQGRGRILEALLFAGYTFCSGDHVFGNTSCMSSDGRISMGSEEVVRGI